METIDLIIKATFFFVNSFAVLSICILVTKWNKRMEDKLDDILSMKKDISVDVYKDKTYIRVGSSITAIETRELKKIFDFVKENYDKEDKQ